MYITVSNAGTRTSGIPPGKDLAIKLQLLHNINRDIDQLEGRINTLKEHRIKVERQIAVLRASKAPISTIAVEILSQIFEHAVCPTLYDGQYVKEDIQCRANISSVCRCWRDIVVNDPVLWRLLLVTTPNGRSTNEQLEWVKQAESYIDISLLRSKGVTLDVVIDLDQKVDGPQYTEDRVREEFGKLVKEDALEDWISNNDMTPMAVAYGRLLERLISSVVGSTGQHMKRWRSLYFILPQSSHDLDDIWKIVDSNGPLPQLISLEGKPECLSLPQISPAFHQVQELHLSYNCSLEFIPRCPRLRDLTLFIDAEFEWNNLQYLDKFPSLKTLTIEMMIFDVSSPRVDIVSLPNLDHLTLAGPFPTTVFKALHCKHLFKLTVDDDLWNDDSILIAPIFSVTEYITYSGRRDFGPKYTRSMFKTLLPQLSSTHTIEVRHFLFEIVVHLVTSSRKSGHLRSLRSVLARDERSGLRDEVYHLPEVVE